MGMLIYYLRMLTRDIRAQALWDPSPNLLQLPHVTPDIIYVRQCTIYAREFMVYAR